MKKTVLKYGLWAGGLVSVIMMTSMILCYKQPEMWMGNAAMIVGFGSMLLAFSFIYVAIKHYRDKLNDGYISFGKAFKIGFLVTLIASTMYVATWALVYNFYMPDFMEVYVAHTQQQAEASGTLAEAQAKAAEMEQYKQWYKNPLLFALITYSEIMPVGLLVTLISSLILMRKRRQHAGLATGSV